MSQQTDLLTFGEAVIAIGRTADDMTDVPADAAALKTMISSVTAAIEAKCGPVVQRSFTQQAAGPAKALALLNRPVVSITTIDGTAASSDVVVHKTSGIAYSQAGYILATSSLVDVVYVAGRCADTASVPARFKDAAALTVADLWRRTKSSYYGTPSYGATDQPTTSAHLLPLSALQLLAGETQVGLA